VFDAIIIERKMVTLSIIFCIKLFIYL